MEGAFELSLACHPVRGVVSIPTGSRLGKGVSLVCLHFRKTLVDWLVGGRAPIPLAVDFDVSYLGTLGLGNLCRRELGMAPRAHARRLQLNLNCIQPCVGPQWFEYVAGDTELRKSIAAPKSSAQAPRHS